MKKLVRGFAMLLVLAMVLVPVSMVHAAAADNGNLALGATATASSSYPGRPWTPDKAVDGNVSGADSRWSSKRATGTTNEGSGDQGTRTQWLLIDLGKVTPVAQLNIYWEGACATKYEIQTSLNGTDFTTAKAAGTNAAGKQVFRDLGVAEAQYVRIYCTDPKVDRYGYSIYEVEIFAKNQPKSPDEAIKLVDGVAPTLSPDGTRLVLPQAPDGYSISLFGSDNRQVVRLDGTVIQPLNDMNVHVMYTLTSLSDPNKVAHSTRDAEIRIPGQYPAEEADNPKPNVLPGLREWKGSQGSFALTDASRILIADSSLQSAAQVVQLYFRDMLKRELPILVSTDAVPGDILMLQNPAATDVGQEGYYLIIDDYVTIFAPTVTGLTYGGASITQILYQDEGMDNAPKGMARDYPKYPVRAGMIDVGRMYIPLEYLQEMVTYMSWFKMNEAHIHINDYWGKSGYSAFRLESEVYPQIVAKDGYYTKNAYRQFQKDMKAFGLDVITEIDSPYHAECFKDVPGVVMWKTGYLDIRTEEARLANQAMLEKLFDEYLDGEDPVIQSNKFHIGTDEYSKSYGEAMRAWTDHFINYVNAKGYQTRLWASLGKNGFKGNTPVSNEATLNLWAPYWADVHEMYNAGYDVINTYGGWLYIVPAGNAGYPDRMNLERLYNQFEVNNFKSGRNPSGEAIMPFAHPQTKGAEFCLWNDMTSFKTGYSWFDIFDRFKAGVAIVSEKTWFGEKQENQTYQQFMARVDALDDKIPGANPGRHVDSKTDLVADIAKDGKDLSGNGYDATLEQVTDGVFTAQSSMSLPFASIGYPYTVTLDVKLSHNDQTRLFAGKDGEVYANIDGSGKVGFKRGAYRFAFNYQLPQNQKVSLTFVSTSAKTILYVNGVSVGEAKLMDPTLAGYPQKCSAFVMPFEQVLTNAEGTLYGLKVWNYAMSAEEIQQGMHMAARDNLALKKPVTVSGLEVNDGRFTAELAVDGEISNTSRVSFAKTADQQWLQVDLGQVYPVSEIVIRYETQVPQYRIEVSENGTDFRTVYEFSDNSLVNGPKPGNQTIRLENPENARYVKYVQLKRWHHTGNGQNYSGSIYELEVYQSAQNDLMAAVNNAIRELDRYKDLTLGYLNPIFEAEARAELDRISELAGTTADYVELMQAKQTVLDLVAEIPQHVTVIPTVDGTNMTLGNQLAMNLLVKKAEADGIQGLTMQLRKSYADHRHFTSLEVPFADWKDYNETYYAVTFDDISAKEMTDNLEALITMDGMLSGKAYNDSVEKYALRILRQEGTGDELKAVIVDLLNYGAEAQKYFHYHEDALANAQLTAQEQALASAAITSENVQVKGEKYYGSNLNLGNSMALTMFFKDITPQMHAVISYEKHTGEKKEILVNGTDFVKFNDTVYGVRANTLVVADAQQAVTVTVYDANNNVVASGTDSIASYVSRGDLGELGQAILKFAASAEIYFANR